MIYRSPDPVADAERYAADCEEQLEKCPVCDGCGDRITDETFYEVVHKGKILRFCDDCVSIQYTSEYIEEKGFFQDE